MCCLPSRVVRRIVITTPDPSATQRPIRKRTILSSPTNFVLQYFTPGTNQHFPSCILSQCGGVCHTFSNLHTYHHPLQGATPSLLRQQTDGQDRLVLNLPSRQGFVGFDLGLVTSRDNGSFKSRRIAKPGDRLKGMCLSRFVFR